MDASRTGVPGQWSKAAGGAVAVGLLCWGVMVQGLAADVPTTAETLRTDLVLVQALQAERRYAEALLKLAETERAFPNEPEVHNLRGSILLAPGGVRDLPAAAAAFDRALALQTTREGRLGPRFNLAEVAFVGHQWPEARRRLEELLKDYPDLPQPLRHLVIFKSLICLLKGGDVPAAEALAKQHFTFMDDSPAHYFANAAMAFQKSQEAEARDWLKRGKSIFGEKGVEPYLDVLMEARWVPNLALPPVNAKTQPD